MRTPQRKPGKYTGKKPDPNLTLAKYHELKEKLYRLKNYTRPPAIKDVKLLALDGDFSDNAGYSMAKGRLRGINRRITEIEDHLKRAAIIDTGTRKDRVALGAKVTIEVGGKQKTYQILGSSETNPEAGIISHNSPLGKALIGHWAGDTAIVNTKNKSVEYKIIRIE